MGTPLQVLLTVALIYAVSSKPSCDTSNGCLDDSVKDSLKLSAPDDKITPMHPKEPVQIVPATSSVSILCDATEGFTYKSWTLVQGDQDISLSNGPFDNIKVVEIDGIHVLEIQHVRTDQAGTYVCETIDPSGTMQYLRLHLIVKDSDTVTPVNEYDMLTTVKESNAVTPGKEYDMVTPGKESGMMTPGKESDMMTFDKLSDMVTRVKESDILTHVTTSVVPASDVIGRPDTNEAATQVAEQTTDYILTDNSTPDSKLEMTSLPNPTAGLARDSLEGVSGSLVAPENVAMDTSTTVFSNTGCNNSKFGCCDDGLTVATDNNKLGCPENVRFALEIGFPSTETAIQSHQLYPPVNFKIVRDAVASDRVSIHVTWEAPPQGNPINRYLLRFSDDVKIDVDYWSKVNLSTNEWSTALRRPSTQYFTISSVSQDLESEQTAVYMYDTEEEMGRLYPDDCIGTECAVTTNSNKAQECDDTRWGCCTDGVTTALGPDGIGCSEGDQSCALSRYECCPDGVSRAKGDDFEGCADADLIHIDSNVNPICLEAPNRTLCTNYTIQWYYDWEIQRCRRFWYGGCATNRNKFVTQDKCTSVCDTDSKIEHEGPACSQATGLVGACKGSYLRWTYNERTNRCEQFHYGGCQGNDNRFLTSEECEVKCLDMGDGRDVCLMPKDSGPCMAAFTRWYYDSGEHACKQFVYGGCAGNQNRFNTEQDCISRCAEIDNTSPQDICLLPQLQGPCRASIPQYSFDPSTGRCNLFYYGGCDGNANRFNDEQTCMNACGVQTREGEMMCSLSPDAGPCKGNFIHWYYDSTSGRCSRFMYGGCQGNTNNYQSEEDCETSCVQQRTTLSVPTTAACDLNYDMGSCGGYEIQWYYDTQNGVCRRFIYSGCGGNSNRFKDEATCNVACKGSGFVTTTERVTEMVTLYAGAERRAVITNTEDKQYAANVGDDVTLRCRAIGYPLPTYIWYKNRSPLDTTKEARKYGLADDSGDLTIRYVTAADTAEYVCRADNGVSNSDYLYTNLVVSDRVDIVGGDEDVVATLGGRVTLECVATGSPTPSVRWSFLGSPIVTSQDDSSLQLSGISSADEGNYVCTADNGVTFDRKIVALTVVAPLQVNLVKDKNSYTEGERLTLTCVTQSYTPVYVSWRKEGVDVNTSSRVTVQGNTLTVNSLVMSDAGYYSCVANNNRETAVSGTTVQVMTLVTTPPPILGPCGDRPYLANCKLIVYYSYCTHEVYQHLCCKSCVDAGQISRYSIKPSRYSLYSPYKYRSNMAVRRRMRR